MKLKAAVLLAGTFGLLPEGMTDQLPPVVQLAGAAAVLLAVRYMGQSAEKDRAQAAQERREMMESHRTAMRELSATFSTEQQRALSTQATLFRSILAEVRGAIARQGVSCPIPAHVSDDAPPSESSSPS